MSPRTTFHSSGSSSSDDARSHLPNDGCLHSTPHRAERQPRERPHRGPRHSCMNGTGTQGFEEQEATTPRAGVSTTSATHLNPASRNSGRPVDGPVMELLDGSTRRAADPRGYAAGRAGPHAPAACGAVHDGTGPDQHRESRPDDPCRQRELFDATGPRGARGVGTCGRSGVGRHHAHRGLPRPRPATMPRPRSWRSGPARTHDCSPQRQSARNACATRWPKPSSWPR